MIYVTGYCTLTPLKYSIEHLCHCLCLVGQMLSYQSPYDAQLMVQIKWMWFILWGIWFGLPYVITALCPAGWFHLRYDVDIHLRKSDWWEICDSETCDCADTVLNVKDVVLMRCCLCSFGFRFVWVWHVFFFSLL